MILIKNRHALNQKNENNSTPPNEKMRVNETDNLIEFLMKLKVNNCFTHDIKCYPHSRNKR